MAKGKNREPSVRESRQGEVHRCHFHVRYGRSGWGNGVCSGDIDNDGKQDLYVTYWGSIPSFATPERAFEDIAGKAGVAGPKDAWSTGCTFLDYDRDGHLDLFVSSYVAFDLKTTPLPGQHAYCTSSRWARVLRSPRPAAWNRQAISQSRRRYVLKTVIPTGSCETTRFYGFTRWRPISMATGGRYLRRQ